MPCRPPVIELRISGVSSSFADPPVLSALLELRTRIAVVQTPLHPLHAVLLAGTVPLFLAVLLSDIAYSASYEMQWKNFASWLIVGGLVFGGFALLWAVIEVCSVLRRVRPRQVVLLFSAADAVRPGLHQCAGSRQGRVGEHACGLSSFRRSLPCSRSRPRGSAFSSPRAGARKMKRFVYLALLALLTACGHDPEPAQYGSASAASGSAARTAAHNEDCQARRNGATGSRRCRRATRSRRSPPTSDPAPDPRPAQWRHPGCRRRGGSAPKLTPKDVIAGSHQGKGDKPGPSGNRLTLLRDSDGDGIYEREIVFRRGSQCALRARARSDRPPLRRQPGCAGPLRLSRTARLQAARHDRSRSRTCLPQINHHWTKALAASADGRFLYVGIGSNSNITERGMTAEVDRAMVWQVDAQTGAHKPYATGLRNPTALAIQPGTGQLWAGGERARRDRSEPRPRLSDRCPEGGFYGWPYSYWGKNVDTRVRPQNPQKVAAAIRPDYSLGSHVAALGLAFSSAGDGRHSSLTACSSGSMAAGTAVTRSATRWSSCPSSNGRRGKRQVKVELQE